MADHDRHMNSGPFELDGGALCLDFANTWGNHADPTADGLTDYDRLVAFSLQTGFLPAQVAAALSRRGAVAPVAADDTLTLARDLRGDIYRIFAAQAAGEEVPADAVHHINGLVGEAMSRRRLGPGEGGYAWRWVEIDASDLRAPIWPVVESAADLLTSDDRDRVRECDADDCNWLFIDRSRSGTRRWCSMKSCGNRAKARRHYRRQQND